MGGKVLDWESDFFTNRKMRVGVKGKYSRWTEITNGVPQGSVLGPLLFLLYVNDLPDWMLNSIVMFADDTKVWTRISGVDDAAGVQQDLNQLQNWSNNWLLKFNIDKCKVMHIGHSHPTQCYLESNGSLVQLQETKEERDLGVLVTADMKPGKQCVQAAAKARSILGMIHRHFKRLNKAQFLTIYKAYVRPHLEYCAQSWSPWLQKDLNCLKRVQR